MTGLLAGALLPPAGLAVVALALVLAGWRRTGMVALAAVVLLSVPAVPHVLVGPLLRPVPHGEAPPGAIIVMSDDPAGAGPGPETLMKLRAAAALARRTGLPVLVAGEAAVSDSLRDDFGIVPRWVAPGRATAWRSAAAVAGLLRADGIGSAYLVGEAWRARLAAALFGAAGLPVWPVSASSARRQEIGWASLLPITPVWGYSQDVIGQWVGLLCLAVPRCAAAAVRPGPS